MSEELNIEELDKLNAVINDETVKQCIDRNVGTSKLLIAKYNEIIIGVIVFNENKKQIKTEEGDKELLNYIINFSLVL